MATFDLLPAVDLRDGRVVRLRQGDFRRETVYAEDPVSAAVQFVEAGAPWLHVVDLDAARDGSRRQADLIRRIVEAVGDRASIEVAGGLRTEAVCSDVLGAGVSRVVVGTAALEDPSLAGRLVGTHGPDRVAVALDVRAGLAVGHGWAPDAPGTPLEAALARLIAAGVIVFEVTAIDRDGTLAGPDLDLLARVTTDRRIRVIASGGIRSADDLRAVRSIGCAGAIVGRALYDGQLMIAGALEATT